jgi:hypothetical protein
MMVDMALSSVRNFPPWRPVPARLLGANHATRPGRQRREFQGGKRGLD